MFYIPWERGRQHAFLLSFLFFEKQESDMTRFNFRNISLVGDGQHRVRETIQETVAVIQERGDNGGLNQEHSSEDEEKWADLRGRFKDHLKERQNLEIVQM